MNAFSKLSPLLQNAIVSELGWTSLRPVQELATEVLLRGDNAIILAPTAGGKTEAAFFPCISRLLSTPKDGIGLLYLAPLKALLNNQEPRIAQYSEMVGLESFVWHGDTSSSARKRFLKQPSEILLTTPESLEVMFFSSSIEMQQLFRGLRMVIVDEIHALAGTDRGAHMMSLLARLAPHSQHKLQRIGLSATIGNPQSLLSWLSGDTTQCGSVIDPPRRPTSKRIQVQYHPELDILTGEAAQRAQGKKSLFFCQARSVTEAVATQMKSEGTEVFVHHSAVSKEERARAEELFQQGGSACIVCTSTLEMGIDIGDLDVVFQAEAPSTVSSFLQRLGRTGRREGKPATMTIFCQNEDSVLQSLALLQLAKEGWVESIPQQTRCWPVLLHQLMALTIAEEGITLEAAWQQLSQIPDCAAIRRAEFERLVAWMLRDESLRLASGRLLLGTKAEAQFGKRNFLELFSIFTTPASYHIELSSGRKVGTLQQDFVDGLTEDSSFLLGGRAWAVKQIQHDVRRVIVMPTSSGDRTTWSGYLPQFLGHTICERTKRILCSNETFHNLSPRASTVLAEKRSELSSVLQGDGMIWVDQELFWWTFAGGKINTTLRYAIQSRQPHWKVTTSNERVLLRGEGVSPSALREVLQELQEPEFWGNEALWRKIALGLPSYRLSKFQSLMPAWVEREILAQYLLSLPETFQWILNFCGANNPQQTEPATTNTALPKEPTIQDEKPKPTYVLLNEQDTAQEIRTRQESCTLQTNVVQQSNSIVLSHHNTTSKKEENRSRNVVYVDTQTHFETMCQALAQETLLGFDVETTIPATTLCLMQIATPEKTYVVDALAIASLSPIQPLLESPSITKVIHNATFERTMMKRYGISIEGVVDTLVLSRQRYGRRMEGGHGLKAVCAREFSLTLDKTEQSSDWTRRPLSPSQLRYAALDAELLLQLYHKFQTDHRNQALPLFHDS